MPNQRGKNDTFSRRAFLLGAGKVSLFSALIARFAYLQLFDTEKYQLLAESNSIRIMVIQPPRGLILDRNKQIIVDNTVRYNALLRVQYQAEVTSIVKQLNNILCHENQISEAALKKALHTVGSNSHILLQNNLAWPDIIKIESDYALRNIEIVKDQKRNYPIAQEAAHITGYVAAPTARELEQMSLPSRYNFPIGKHGIEKVFNQQLLGKHGVRKIEVNANNKFVKEISNLPPSIGSMLELSVDLNLQKIVAENLRDINGSAVILNAMNGEVLALHSSPSFDPNEFVISLDHNYWNKIRTDSNHPLINKAISASYPPGSVFKVVTALAILNSGISPSNRVFCSGECVIGNRTFRCWNEAGHGWVNLKSAIAKSCNVYFYTLGLQARIDAIMRAATSLGLHSTTGIELPFERSGFIPNKEWIQNKLKGRWSAGDTVNASIGQGYILTTPIQLATIMAKIASGFNIKTTMLRQEEQKPEQPLDIKDEHLQSLREGLYNVFNNQEGTGYTKRSTLFNLSGKTGTAQVRSQAKRKQILSHKLRDHGLFAGYTHIGPYLCSIAVVAEHSGWGSVSALPIAIKILEQYENLTREKQHES